MNKLSKDYITGFERAIELTLGTKAKWSPSELKIRNRVTRRLFGRKRAKK